MNARPANCVRSQCRHVFGIERADVRRWRGDSMLVDERLHHVIAIRSVRSEAELEGKRKQDETSQEQRGLNRGTPNSHVMEMYLSSLTPRASRPTVRPCACRVVTTGRFTAPNASDRAWSRGPNPRGGTVPSTPPVDRGAHAVVANSRCTYRGSTTPDRSPTDRAVRARPRHTTRSGYQGVFLDHRPWAAVHDCLASAARLQRARTLSTVIANSKPAGRRHGSRMAVAMRYCGDGIPSGMSASPFVDFWVPSRQRLIRARRTRVRLGRMLRPPQ